MTYRSALNIRSCAKREGSWTFARVSVQTYACACGPRMGHTTWRMGWHWTGELDRRGCRFFEGGECHIWPNLDGP
jgi:hypothetical protein